MSATTKLKATGRRLPLAAVCLALLLASIVSACSGQDSNVKLVREPVSQALGAATSADVEIALAVGQLRIGALEQPGTLIAGLIAYPQRHTVSRDFAERGGAASFSLREQDGENSAVPRYNKNAPVWDLRLSPTTPLRLAVETGVGENVIDLAGLQMTELTLKNGVGATTLTLPRTGRVQATVEGGVGKTTIRVPAGVGVRLTADAGLGGTDVPASYRQQGDAYVSPEYDTATAQVELQASTGVGNVTIEQLGE